MLSWRNTPPTKYNSTSEGLVAHPRCSQLGHIVLWGISVGRPLPLLLIDAANLPECGNVRKKPPERDDRSPLLSLANAVTFMNCISLKVFCLLIWTYLNSFVGNRSSKHSWSGVCLNILHSGTTVQPNFPNLNQKGPYYDITIYYLKRSS